MVLKYKFIETNESYGKRKNRDCFYFRTIKGRTNSGSLSGWTYHKIKVHYFICVMGYLLSASLLRQVREKTKFKGYLDSLLNILSNIRLATLLEESNTRSRVKAVYKLEEMSKEEKSILQALEIEDLHNNRPKLKGVGVYK